MMIAVNEALNIALLAAKMRPSVLLPLKAAAGLSLAADVIAPIDHPIFDQSAVDGYAFRFEDLANEDGLLVVDMVRAGDDGLIAIKPGQCSRIFTGAPLPPGADTVVMQELCRREGAAVHMHDAGLRRGGNVRRAGEQIRAGALALGKGAQLNPAAIGFLASLGIQSLHVFPAPRIHILVTGDEFAQDAADFKRGKIFESNGQMLVAALAQLGIQASFETCEDDLQALTDKVHAALHKAELLILTGGVSVGDFDFSRAALEANQFQVGFHQVAQKPGKPLLFTHRADQYAFGLPGNPRAVLICFYLYVLPFIQALQGQNAKGLRSLRLPLQHDFKRKLDGKTHFMTGKLVDGQIQLLGGQQSHMLHSLAEADAIVQIPADLAAATAGELFTCYLLP